MRLVLGKWGNTKDRLISNLFQRATADGGVLGSSVACIDAAYSSADNSSLLTMVPAFGKAGKLYSIIPESGAGDFAVVRGTTASYVGQDGLIRFAANNEPRFDWTNGCPALLVEPAATNLILRSNEFSNAYWSKVFTTVVTGEQDPEGLTTAFALRETAVTNIHGMELTAGFSVTSGTTYSFSIFAKDAGRFFQFSTSLVGFGANIGAEIDLTNGTVTQTFGGASPIVQPFANGYYRISFAATATSTTTANIFNYLAPTSGGVLVPSYAGNTLLGVDIYGMQIEAGSVATSYIPTVAATATRNADVITVTPPAGTSEIVTTFEDGTTQVVTSIPGTFTIPNGRVAKVEMT